MSANDSTHNTPERDEDTMTTPTRCTAIDDSGLRCQLDAGHDDWHAARLDTVDPETDAVVMWQ